MAWGRSWMTRVGEPPTLLTDGTAPVRVRGRALGWVRCQDERRWVWGDFDETFRVRAPAGAFVVFHVMGLLGRASLQVPWRAQADLVSPPSPLPSARSGPVARPRLRSVRVELPSLRLLGLPRVRRITGLDVRGDRLDEQRE